MKTISPTSYLSRLCRHILPVTVWICVVVCIAALFVRRTQRFEVLGIAQGQVRQVAASCTGRLTSIPVQLFDQVSLGDEVAVVDTILDNEQPQEQLQAQIDTIEAEIKHLASQFVQLFGLIIALFFIRVITPLVFFWPTQKHGD